jgi:hypothetical protein
MRHDGADRFAHGSGEPCYERAGGGCVLERPLVGVNRLATRPVRITEREW